jgi:katanin p60 ATPase-containing subunit A1
MIPLTQVLFDLARHHAPATIFLDEVDALMGARGVEGEHEASRRMKTELLIQMDGLTRSSSSSSSSSGGGGGGSSAGQPAEPQVFVLAASNLPWDLDMALLRRLQKRILVPLPDAAARRGMLEGLLVGRLEAGVTVEGLVGATQGYSGEVVSTCCNVFQYLPPSMLQCSVVGVFAVA